MSQPDETRLNDLKQRWAQDPSSRLYLQLADEHRKLGQLAEAEAVLSQGLEKRPGDLSGLVALGRARLELGKLDAAAETLESVVTRDPTHIVANKLLLETHLQRGDAPKAGERLDICRLLNDRDPEIDDLEGRLGALKSAGPELEAEEAGAVDAVTQEEPVTEAVPVVASEGPPPPPADTEPSEAPTVVPGKRPEPAGRDEDPFAFLMEQMEAPVQQDARAPVAAEPEAGGEAALREQAAAPEAVTVADPASGELRPENVEDRVMPSPSTPSDSRGDDIFALGDESVAETPSLESLWIEHSTPKRRADPFAGLGGFSSFAPGEIFSQPPAEAPATAPTVFEESPVEVEDSSAGSEESILGEPEAPAADDVPGAGEPAVYEELVETAGGDLLLDTQRTRFAVDVASEPASVEMGSTDVSVAEREAITTIDSLLETAANEAVVEEPSAVEEVPVAADAGPAVFEEAIEPVLEEPRAVEEPPVVEEPPAVPEEPVGFADVFPAPPVLAEGAVVPEAEPRVVESPVFEELAAEEVASDEAAAEKPPVEAPLVDGARPQVPGEEVATAALGRLYLEQGHTEEAVRIFDRILERDPGNPEALSGLQLARGPEESKRLTATDLLADSSLSGTIPAGTTAKKLLLLGNYLKHIRTARNRQHVR